MRISPHELAIEILEGKYEEPVPDRDWALLFLREFSRCDFGQDASRWRSWINAHCDDVTKRACLYAAYSQLKGKRPIE